MSENKEVKIKKVPAYPIATQLKTLTKTYSGSIQKITLIGFLVEIPGSDIQPGDKLECTFELPVSHKKIDVHCKTIKVYTQWGDETKTAANATGTRMAHLVELHFETLGADSKKAIVDFLTAIAGKKTGSSSKSEIKS